MSYVAINPELVSLSYANDVFFLGEMLEGDYLIGFFLPNGLFYIHDAKPDFDMAEGVVNRMNGGKGAGHES